MRFDFESLVEPSVTANGCDLWGIDFIHGANSPILRVFIDAVGGATIEDCENILKYPIKINSDIQVCLGPYGTYIKSGGKNYKIKQNIDYTEEYCLSVIRK